MQCKVFCHFAGPQSEYKRRIEYKNWHDWVDTAIHSELCKKMMLDHVNKRYITQPRICPGEWNAQTLPGFWVTNRSPNLSQITRPCNKQQKKENLSNYRLVPADLRVNLKESEKKDKYMNLARELKKLWNKKVTIIPIVIRTLGTVTKRIGKRTGGYGKKKMSGDHPNYNTVEISKNTEKSPGDLRRLAVS